jgi:hypothetical protein
VAILILLGAVLGPYGAGVLSARVLAALDPVVPAALAALGVLVSASAGMSAFANGTALTRRIEIALVAAGAVLVAAFQERAFLPAIAALLQTTVLAATVAAAAWLILRRSDSDIEQRIVTLAAVVLLAGTADALSGSPLFCGFVAGMFWRYARGPAGDLIMRDLTHVRPPVVALVLVIAGARVELPAPAFAAALAAVAALWIWSRRPWSDERLPAMRIGLITVASVLMAARLA